MKDFLNNIYIDNADNYVIVLDCTNDYIERYEMRFISNFNGIDDAILHIFLFNMLHM